MKYSQEELTRIFSQGAQLIKEYHLPSWEELPSIPLYMDQVVLLLNRYLGIFSAVSNEEKLITSTMINNYVKMKIIPAPVKKKYAKVHMAYLIMVCTLKQTLSISVISHMLPVDMNEEEIQAVYDSFAKNQATAFSYVTKQVEAVAKPILSGAEVKDDRLTDLVMQIAVSSNIFKLLISWITEFKKDDDAS